MARTAQVKRDARIGEAEARRDAGIRVIIPNNWQLLVTNTGLTTISSWCCCWCCWLLLSSTDMVSHGTFGLCIPFTRSIFMIILGTVVCSRCFWSIVHQRLWSRWEMMKGFAQIFLQKELRVIGVCLNNFLWLIFHFQLLLSHSSSLWWMQSSHVQCLTPSAGTVFIIISEISCI